MLSKYVFAAAWMVVTAVSLTSTRGQDIKFQGVLANSGEQGSTLVRFSPSSGMRFAVGMGVVYDRFGTLWDRAGPGVLNRYAVDGRLLGTFRIPQPIGNSDRLTAVGDTLVMLLQNRLYTMNVVDAAGSGAADSSPSAKSKSAVTDLNLPAKLVSTNANQGRLAVIAGDGELSWVDVVSGKAESITKLPESRIQSLEVMSDGAILYFADNHIRRVVEGKVISDDRWPRRIHGDRENVPAGLQRIGDIWFSFTGHGTIKRYNTDLSPQPGVVLGGGSGWVIGRVPANSEIGTGQGMARINDRLFAVSGYRGVMHLLRWDEQAGRMNIVRRIGAIQNVPGLAIDQQGRITIGSGTWEWEDSADSPMSELEGPEFAGQPAMLDNGSLASAATRYDGSRTGWISGPLSDVYRMEERADYLPGGDSPVSATAWRSGKLQRVLMINSKGIGTTMQVAPDGQLQRVLGGFRLEVGVAIKSWTSLAIEDAQHLLAAGDGTIYCFASTEDGFVSQGLWSPVVTDDRSRLGDQIMLASDAGLLWVADTNRHRVLCYDLSSKKMVGQFGTTDKAGSDCQSLNRPTTIACRGVRAVVFDSENQRIVKLSSK